MSRNYFFIFLFFLSNQSLADTIPPSFSYIVGVCNPPMPNYIASDKQAACDEAISRFNSCNLQPQASLISCTHYPQCGTPYYNGSINIQYTFVPTGRTPPETVVANGPIANVMFSCPVGYAHVCSATPSCVSFCNAPQFFNTQTYQCESPPLPEKNPPRSCSPDSGFPIKYTTGNKVLTEVDYLAPSNITPEFVRHYSAQFNGRTSIGTNWLAAQQSQVVIAGIASASGSQLIMVRSNGLRYPYTYNGSVWTTDADVTDKLIELKDTNGNRTGWT